MPLDKLTQVLVLRRTILQSTALLLFSCMMNLVSAGNFRILATSTSERPLVMIATRALAPWLAKRAKRGLFSLISVESMVQYKAHKEVHIEKEGVSDTIGVR